MKNCKLELHAFDTTTGICIAILLFVLCSYWCIMHFQTKYGSNYKKNERKKKYRNPLFGGQNWKNNPSCLFRWKHRNDVLSVSSNYFSNVDCFTGGAFM